MPNLHVVALATAKPGKEAQLQAVLETLVAPSRAEAGSIAYHLHRSTENPALFVFTEVWTDAAALDAHLNGPVIKTALPKLDGVLESLDVKRLELID